MALAGKNLELAMRIRADLQQAIGELKQLEGAVEANGRQAESTGRDMEKLGKNIGNVIAAFAGGAVYKAVIGATIEQERVTAQLEQRLRSTAGAAGLNRDELLEMASAMQQVTTYGDEAVIPAQSLLLTFTKIGREVFPRALETVLDMSTAMAKTSSPRPSSSARHSTTPSRVWPHCRALACSSPSSRKSRSRPWSNPAALSMRRR